MAKDAYDALLKIEAGHAETITDMLKETLLAPIEPWRRYELAVCYGIAEVLAELQNMPLTLNFVVGDVRKQVAGAGRFSVFWQWRTDYYIAPTAEPSEIKVQGILDAYGLSAASDRPDLIIVDNNSGRAVAIVEVKYLTGEDASDRIRSAVGQIVRYSRGYIALAEASTLLGRSLIAVSQGLDGIDINPVPSDGIPAVIDFDGVKGPQLRAWVHRLLH